MKNNKITILGYGKSGIAAAKLAKHIGFDVFISDSRKLIPELLETEYKYELGGHSQKIYDSNIIVVSPGISKKTEIKKNAIKKGIRFISEIEFASTFTESKIIGITGSNGKTTVSKLIYRILKDYGLNVMLGGNIGIPFSENVYNEMTKNRNNNYHVVEISSFQLEDIENFNPDISCLLNITSDHLDRYNNEFMEYTKTKFKIIKNYDKDKNSFIYNADDTTILNYIDKYFDNNFTPFSISENSLSFFFLKDEKIYGENNFCLDLSKINLVGKHNFSNIIAALNICKHLDIKLNTVKQTIINFNPVEHRIEHVKEYNGINFFNDSKATNISSTIAAIRSFSNNIVLLLGGIDKSSTDFLESLKQYLTKIRIVLCYGESGEYIYNQLKLHFTSIHLNKGFDDMLERLRSVIKKGDNVLLSPGCTSFDQFDSFESRGLYYKSYIKENFN